MRHAQRSLLALVIRIFSDGVLTAEERKALTGLYRDSGLTVSEVRAVLVEFVKATWTDVMADGVVTKEERERLSTIVRELRLPAEFIPLEVSAVIGGVGSA
jgi:hypothetical protein